MKYFPDEPATGAWAIVYLIVALLYSAASAPWGRRVDPESTYAMNGLAWAAGYPMMKNDHPGTTTILLTGLVIKLWRFLAGQSDVVEFGLKNFDAIIYASRAAEALILSGALLASGVHRPEGVRSMLFARAFKVPLLDYNFYRDLWSRNFHPYSYRHLAAEYPCIVVRTARELNAETGSWLLESHPDHCVVEGIQVYTVGIPCEKIRRAAQSDGQCPQCNSALGAEKRGIFIYLINGLYQFLSFELSLEAIRPPGGGRIG